MTSWLMFWERIVTVTKPERIKTLFKVLQSDGAGDVEYFIPWFEEIRATNNWKTSTTFLHLREIWQEGIQDYRRATTVSDIFEALKARYGNSPREARRQLNIFWKESASSLQERATNVRNLVRLGYSELSEDYQNRMSLDIFYCTLENADLLRHLLAINTPT